MSGRAQILSLYRRILFAAARFPSKNRTNMTRSSGNWEITMEKNPMPKPPSADASSSGGGAAGAS